MAADIPLHFLCQMDKTLSHRRGDLAFVLRTDHHTSNPRQNTHFHSVLSVQLSVFYYDETVARQEIW